jgi:hypothetical protein
LSITFSKVFVYVLGFTKELTESVEIKDDARKILDVAFKLWGLQSEMLKF